MRRSAVLLTVSVLALSLLAGVPAVFAAEQSMHQNELKAKAPVPDQTFKCEVVDVSCYVSKGAHGDAHQGCAAKCISEGGELALLYNGKLYVPVDAKFHSARKKFVSKGGEKVTVTGHIVHSEGINYLQLAQ
jgi:hypothetical protein